MDPGGPALRQALDGDGDALIALIAACYSEYPGCILDVDREEPALRAIATDFGARGGRFWVAEEAGKVVGCVGAVPSRAPGGMELKKLYVAREARRLGLGARLEGMVEAEARARGADHVELWSDTRFLDAHRLYERLGYVRGLATRELHDLSQSVEYYFRKRLC
ncbi:MAG TPA: GNAT family N-acetyltransferase [Planctomycetota bacterium]|nr:GNAT family N-acetyltransferase [Planctomycetota bacterium]